MIREQQQTTATMTPGDISRMKRARREQKARDEKERDDRRAARPEVNYLKKVMRVWGNEAQHTPLNLAIHDHPRFKGRLAHLSEAQRRERVETASHEAAHVVAAVALGSSIHQVIVRIPGKTPKSILPCKRAPGSVSDHLVGLKSGIGAAAGVFFEALATGEHLTRGGGDITICNNHISGRLKTHNLPAARWERPTARGILMPALNIVLRHWKIIDATAVAILLLADSTGVVQMDKSAQLSKYVAALLKNPDLLLQRITYFTLPAGAHRACDKMEANTAPYQGRTDEYSLIAPHILAAFEGAGVPLPSKAELEKILWPY